MKNKNVLYEAGIKRQKQKGWALIIAGTILTLTLIGALIGIPLIIIGIINIHNKKVTALTGFIVKNEITKGESK